VSAATWDAYVTKHNAVLSAVQTVGVVKDYITQTPGLEPLTSSVHYSLLKMRKKTKKLTNSLKGYK